jgi:hypothetical protein
MADVTSASIIPIPQPRPKTPAERARAYRARKRAKGPASDRRPDFDLITEALPPVEVEAPPATVPVVTTDTTVTAPIAIKPRKSPDLARAFLAFAAFGLAGCGVTMNAMFGHSLGVTDASGVLFTALGVAADCAALCLPSVAANAWTARQRVTAAMGWAVFAVTFMFAVTAGIGFASVNIADVTLARASRTSPAIVTAQGALEDAQAARDRECKTGTGRFCRQREDAVTEARHGLETAMATLASTSDPQTTAVTKLVTWISRGTIAPTPDDVGMIRLALLALLPQIGGILLMIGRAK